MQQQLVGGSGSGGAAHSSGGHHGGLGGGGGGVGPSAPAGNKREGPSGANVFVHGVPVGCTDADLVGLFSMYGSLLSARLATDKASGAPKNFGFVAFELPAAAAAACAALNGSILPKGSAPGKRLKVELRMTPTAV